MATLNRYEWNATEFAELCQTTVQSLHNWVEEGMPGPDKPTKNSAYFDLRIHLPWVIDHKWKPGQDDIARKRRAEANMAEREDALGEGSVMLVAEAEKVWGNALAGIRARLLSIPPKVGALLAANLTVAERSEIVRREIYEALESLSGPPEAVVDEPEEEQEPPTLKRRPGRPARKASA